MKAMVTLTIDQEFDAAKAAKKLAGLFHGLGMDGFGLELIDDLCPTRCEFPEGKSRDEFQSWLYNELEDYRVEALVARRSYGDGLPVETRTPNSDELIAAKQAEALRSMADDTDNRAKVIRDYYPEWPGEANGMQSIAINLRTEAERLLREAREAENGGT